MTLPQSHRVAVLTGPESISVVEQPIPRPGPLELLVRVRMAGICGTDLALFRGDYAVDLPLVPGHEFCGEVVEGGEGTEPSWSGASVTSEISFGCRHDRREPRCAACEQSLPSHCLHRRVLGIRGAPGAFAEYVVVPAGAALRLPDGFPVWGGAVVEPVAAAIQTFEGPGDLPGQVVAVLGAGRLGLLVTRIAQSFGARPVAFSRSAARRELALRFGAREVFDPDDAADREAFLRGSDGLGADVVVDCTGSPAGLAGALRLVRPRGTVVVKTTCGLPAEAFDVTDVVVRELTIRGSRCGPLAKAVERLAAGKIPLDDYVSGVFPLDQIAEAFEASTRATKVLLEP